MKTKTIYLSLAGLAIAGFSFVLGRLATNESRDQGLDRQKNTRLLFNEAAPRESQPSKKPDEKLFPQVKTVPEISDEDEALNPGLRKARIAFVRVTGLAKESLAEAIRACNEEMGAYTQTPLPQNALPLESVLASSIYETCFGRQCLFVGDSAGKLRNILKSDLTEPVKEALLKLSSAAGEGNPEISSNVLKIALEHSKSPTVFASVIADIVRVSPDMAVEILENRPWKPEFSIATSRLYAEYVILDSQKGSAAVADLSKESPAYQWAAAGIVQAVRGTDPEAAEKWMGEITDSEAAVYAKSFTYIPRENPQK
jgi:hypothetical protein